MLRRLFVLTICMSFAGNVMAANFAGREFDYYDFSSPTTGYALWNQVIDSFKSDEFINSARSENEWEESDWKTTFMTFFDASFPFNLCSPCWSIKRRHKAGDKAQEVLDYLINQNIHQSIFNNLIKRKLESIINRSKDEDYCHKNDVDNDGNLIALHDLDDYTYSL